MEENKFTNLITEKPLVSLVIPVFNSAGYLRQCLDSVLSQTWKQIEVVCVNDGSTDSSLAILNEYAEKDVRVRVFSKENEGKGAASARNLGLEQAEGQFIQFVDSDDFFEPDMVESMVRKAIQTCADVVICTGQIYDHERGCTVGRLPHPDLHYAPEFEPFSWHDCSEYICEIADFYAWNKLFHRKLLTDHQLRFTPIPIADDQDISMLAPVLADRVAIVNRALINYRTGTGTSQCDSQTKHPEAAYAGTYSVVQRFRELGIYEEIKQSYLNVTIRLMREYFDRMTALEKLRHLYQTYREEIFPMLEAEDLPEGYFHDWRVESWYRMILSSTLEEILFAAVRAGGGTMTTAPLRFQVPYQNIRKNSRVVLVGKNLTGRFWYSQLLLSGYCEVVYWTDSEDNIPEDIRFDAILKTS